MIGNCLDRMLAYDWMEGRVRRVVIGRIAGYPRALWWGGGANCWLELNLKRSGRIGKMVELKIRKMSLMKTDFMNNEYREEYSRS